MQVRVPVSEIAGVIRGLVDGLTLWAETSAQYPAQAAPADTEEGN